MTSNYFKYKRSFEDLIDNDPINISNSEYWNLNIKNYNNFSYECDIFTQKELERIIVIGKRLKLDRATTGGNGKNCLDHRRSFVSWINVNPLTFWIYEKLTDVLKKHNEQYFQFDLDKIEKLQFTYYTSEENGCYKAHVDPMTWNVPHNRKLSFVLQLSDPNDYRGGELRLYNSNTPTIIEKKQGLLTFFPSYTLHEVSPVTIGERYSLVGWVHGPAFK